MIGVRQTILGPPEGNCFAACVASILELPTDEMPNYHGPLWWEDWIRWASDNGYELECYWTSEMNWCPTGYWIAGPLSPRNPKIVHAVVVYHGEIVWDPYPHWGGVVDLSTTEDCMIVRPRD